MSRDELIALVGVQAKQIAVLMAMNDELVGKLARVGAPAFAELREFLHAAVQG